MVFGLERDNKRHRHLYGACHRENERADSEPDENGDPRQTLENVQAEIKRQALPRPPTRGRLAGNKAVSDFEKWDARLRYEGRSLRTTNTNIGWNRRTKREHSGNPEVYPRP